jgi:hypothetical protein
MKSIPNNNQQKYRGFVKHPFVISVRMDTSLFQISLIEFCAENFTLLKKKLKAKNTCIVQNYYRFTNHTGAGFNQWGSETTGEQNKHTYYTCIIFKIQFGTILKHSKYADNTGTKVTKILRIYVWNYIRMFLSCAIWCKIL